MSFYLMVSKMVEDQYSTTYINAVTMRWFMMSKSDIIWLNRDQKESGFNIIREMT